MQLHLSEQDQAEVIKLFDELDALTRGPFEQAKAEIDERLAANCGIEVDELRPWHYHDPFFQEAPAVYDTSLDAPFKQLEKEEKQWQRAAGIVERFLKISENLS